MSVPSEPSATPTPSSTPAAADPPAAATPPAGEPSKIDLTTLSVEDLTKVLEHPKFFDIPRVKQLREQAAEADKLKKAQSDAEDKALTEQKKFEDLATKRGEENATLQAQLKDLSVNNALTIKLASENVVDVDGALKLIDRSKISVDDNGQVQGVDDALASLKTEKGYLFASGGTPSQPQVGNPSNPSNQPAGNSGQFKFKESQLTAAFYNEHKAEIDEAGRLGLIEPDGPPQQ